MANIPFYEGDTVTLQWGETSHTCTVHRHAASCVLCGGAVVRIVPPWSGWELLCCYESALVVRTVARQLAPGAIGQVVSLPVRVMKGA
jgi:hypothetical protein